ncbi:protein kinase domain protein, partial [Metarhizium hybridum]
MKFLKAVGVAIIYAQGALSMPASAEQDCGSLGVMKVDEAKLPEGVDASQVRKCLGHPEGHGTDHSGKALFARVCEFRWAWGCSRGGYCWKSCDPDNNGKWCWTAEASGLGPWIRCSSYKDCEGSMACGEGGCKECGCSC